MRGTRLPVFCWDSEKRTQNSKSVPFCSVLLVEMSKWGCRIKWTCPIAFQKEKY